MNESESTFPGHPWPFSEAELTAGLRRHTGDPTLKIRVLTSRPMPHRRPAIGRVRGLTVMADGSMGVHAFELVVKEPKNSARAGMVQDGIREVSVYGHLADHLPVRIPGIIASQPQGEWFIMETLPDGHDPQTWTAAEYLLSIDQLVALHDRFWNLDEFLEIYRWLRRPLGGDLELHRQAAQNGLNALQVGEKNNRFAQNQDLITLIETINENLEDITTTLKSAPATLLHGDYWPGNVNIYKDGSLTVFDWEQAAIGPAVLDLLTFIQNSQWWFNPLPIPPEEIISHYHARLKQSSGYTWKKKDWNKLWDMAILWVFVSNWIDLLAKIPDTMLDERMPELESVLFEPVRQAAKRQFKGKK